ncbi:pyridoxamine 5'-phosphate oxidase-domain-containing protein [Absidia repens]|uniref:Pyridoxamine 5'-phosphate oxidase-domain-containing protein n=1 Tax=Absidia repens TaxID=90262 RepID=A0A1X2IA89_9FUNG|nr:pyridoxamine 5'-phosphate oxidase-domain-containing protein [Absidia repens]
MKYFTTFFAVLIIQLFFVFCQAGQDVTTAASLARQVVEDTGLGTMLTLVDSSVNEDFEGFPFGLMEYYADGCTAEDNGDLLLFMSNLQINSRNAQHQRQKIGFTIRSLKEINQPIGNTSTPVQQPRFTLLGELVQMPKSLRKHNMACFGKMHKEAKFWEQFHDFNFYRLEVQSIYYVGGFGGMNYIGWIPLDLYQKKDKRLPLLRQD